MKNIVFILSIFILAGCASMNQFEGEISSPELLKQYPLPSIPLSIYTPNFALNLKLLILDNGTVKQATILNKTGNEEWDSLAQESILKWVYLPARIKDRPVSMWVNQKVCVEFDDPVYINLAEILCDTLETAQRVYEALIQNENFGEQAIKYSVDPSHSNNGLLGNVDIRLFPNYIQTEILKLGNNEFTKPIKYGDQYIIFKKISD
ncbi:MAG: peptidylprolyl isomerase [Ignavibacteriaceae bacterium]